MCEDASSRDRFDCSTAFSARSLVRSEFVESRERFSLSTATFTNTTPVSRIPLTTIQRMPPRARARARRLECAELVVHLDAQRLEDALGRMTLAEACGRRDRGLDHLDEIAGALEGLFLAPLDDRTCDLARVALFAVALEDVGQLP